ELYRLLLPERVQVHDKLPIAHGAGNRNLAGAARHAAGKPDKLAVGRIPACKAHGLLAGLALAAENDADEAAGADEVATAFFNIGNDRADIADALALHGDRVPRLLD